MTFRAFLLLLRLDESPAGDLARDALADTGWTGNTAGSLRSRLHEQCIFTSTSRAHEVLDAVEAAYGTVDKVFASLGGPR